MVVFWFAGCENLKSYITSRGNLKSYITSREYLRSYITSRGNLKSYITNCEYLKSYITNVEGSNPTWLTPWRPQRKRSPGAWAIAGGILQRVFANLELHVQLRMDADDDHSLSHCITWCSCTRTEVCTLPTFNRWINSSFITKTLGHLAKGSSCISLPSPTWSSK